MFQASQGKNFHQKLTISDDSKMIPKCVPADLGLPSSACQSRIVKHSKFDHVLDTIFCAFWTEFVHRALLSSGRQAGRGGKHLM